MSNITKRFGLLLAGGLISSAALLAGTEAKVQDKPAKAAPAVVKKDEGAKAPAKTGHRKHRRGKKAPATPKVEAAAQAAPKK